MILVRSLFQEFERKGEKELLLIIIIITSLEGGRWNGIYFFLININRNSLKIITINSRLNQ